MLLLLNLWNMLYILYNCRNYIRTTLQAESSSISIVKTFGVESYRAAAARIQLPMAVSSKGRATAARLTFHITIECNFAGCASWLQSISPGCSRTRRTLLNYTRFVSFRSASEIGRS